MPRQLATAQAKHTYLAKSSNQLVMVQSHHIHTERILLAPLVEVFVAAEHIVEHLWIHFALKVDCP